MSVDIFCNTAGCGTQSVTELRSIVEASNNDNKVENSYWFVPLPYISYQAAKIKSDKLRRDNVKKCNRYWYF